MDYAAYISHLRSEAKDLAVPTHFDFRGDGTIAVFTVDDAPILEASYVVKVAGTQKTEGADYTIDRELGAITFATAPALNAAVTIDYKCVHLTDASYIRIINEVLADMSGPFFREVLDDDFDVSEADARTYAAPDNCIDVINWWYRTADDESINWVMVREFSNWRYSMDENDLHLGRPFSTAGYPMKLHYLVGYIPGTASTSTLDIQPRYEGVLTLGCLHRYYDHRMPDRVETDTKVTRERTVTPLQNLQALSQHYYKLYLKEKGRRAPTKPMRLLTSRVAGGGQP